MEAASSEKPNRFFPVLLFLVAVCLRLPFTSKLLYHHDSVNFALAIDHFDLRLHQPHPPGYLLYVMLAKVLNFFLHDCNLALIAISVAFTSLSVVMLYLLGKEMYDFRTGIIAAALATASPNLWFHGEIALSYGVEAFFSAAIGYLCWHVYKGRGELIFTSALLLGLAGGFRQNTLVFLLPLWLLSVRRYPLARVLAALALVALVCGAWLFATVSMTGGSEAYASAFQGLWDSNTGHNSVFEKGWGLAWLYARTLATFSLYSLGAGIAVLLLGLYSVVRSGDWKGVSRGNGWFYLAWMLPGYLFYQLIFIQPANPGYFLVLLPPLVLLCARGIVRMVAVVETKERQPCAAVATVAVVVANAGMFLFAELPTSQWMIKRHDRDLAAMLQEMRRYDPATTAIVLKPYVFCGFRMVMYYLPQYRVYDAATSTPRLWGTQGRTFVADSQMFSVDLPQAATLDFGEGVAGDRRSISGLNSVWLVSGPCGRIIKEITHSPGLSPSTSDSVPQNR